VVEQFRVPVREGSPQTTWNLGKTNAAVSVCSFLGDPAGAGLVPKPRPICLSAAQAVGARIMPHAPPPQAGSVGCHMPQESKKTNETGFQTEAGTPSAG
jgi:hypothetical protein